MSTMKEIRNANQTFFSRAAKKFHGTTHYTKDGLRITSHDTFVGSDGTRIKYDNVYEADPITLKLKPVSN